MAKNKRGAGRRGHGRKSPTRKKAQQLLVGKISVTQGGFGFVSTPEGEFFVPARRLAGAMNGDTVEISVSTRRAREKGGEVLGGHSARGAGRGAQGHAREDDKNDRARVHHVIARAQTHIVGKYFAESPIGVVVPDDSRIAHDFFVIGEVPDYVSDESIVRLQIIDYPTPKSAACGRIVGLVGREGDPGLVFERLIAASAARVDFPADVLAEAATAEVDVAGLFARGYRDLQSRVVFTIDPADAKDFDDALSLDLFWDPQGGGGKRDASGCVAGASTDGCAGAAIAGCAGAATDGRAGASTDGRAGAAIAGRAGAATDGRGSKSARAGEVLDASATGDACERPDAPGAHDCDLLALREPACTDFASYLPQTAHVLERRVDGRVWRLGVHIADVSAYVAADSALDVEARARGCSIYLPDRVVPMLPEALSNEVCSLKPGEPRAAMTCDLYVADDATLVAYDLYRAVICSDARLTYDQAQQILDLRENLDLGDLALMLKAGLKGAPAAGAPGGGSAFGEPVGGSVGESVGESTCVESAAGAPAGGPPMGGSVGESACVESAAGAPAGGPPMGGSVGESACVESAAGAPAAGASAAGAPAAGEPVGEEVAFGSPSPSQACPAADVDLPPEPLSRRTAPLPDVGAPDAASPSQDRAVACADVSCFDAGICARIAGVSALGRAREAWRVRRGAVDFDTAEARVVLDAAGEACAIDVRRKTAATGLVEEAMIFANEVVATHLMAAKWPCVFRDHEPPAAEGLANLAAVLGEFDWFGRGMRARLLTGEPAAICAAMRAAAGRPERDLVVMLCLRAMSRAVYSARDAGHFGLGLNAYCHFTSPIRRYPDLIVHRLLARELAGGKPGIAAGEMDLISETSSLREREAEELSRKCTRAAMAQYMQRHVGCEFGGLIVGVSQAGLFVRLDNMVEGFLERRALGGEFFVFNDAHHTLTGVNTKRKFRLGGRLRVKVKACDALSGRIELTLGH